MVQSVLIFSIRDERAELQSTALHIQFLGHCTIARHYPTKCSDAKAASKAMLIFKSVQHEKNDFENPTRDPGPGTLQDTSHKSVFFFLNLMMMHRGGVGVNTWRAHLSSLCYLLLLPFPWCQPTS